MPGNGRRQTSSPTSPLPMSERRKADWLLRAHSALMAQADAIGSSTTDATLRQGFLQNIPHHREIVAWAQRDVASESPARNVG